MVTADQVRSTGARTIQVRNPDGQVSNGVTFLLTQPAGRDTVSLRDPDPAPGSPLASEQIFRATVDYTLVTANRAQLVLEILSNDLRRLGASLPALAVRNDNPVRLETLPVRVPESGGLRMRARLLDETGAQLAASEVLVYKFDPDLVLDHLEVIQVTQFDGSTSEHVPLVAGKTTVVRAFPIGRDLTSRPPVSGILSASRNGRDLPDLFPFSGFVATLPDAIDRNDQSTSLQFKLTEEWVTEGELKLTVTVFALDSMGDPDLDFDGNFRNNGLPKTVEFFNTRGLIVGYVPILMKPPGGREVPATGRMEGMAARANRLFPLGEGRLDYRDTEVPHVVLPYSEIDLDNPAVRRAVRKKLSTTVALFDGEIGRRRDSRVVFWLHHTVPLKSHGGDREGVSLGGAASSHGRSVIMKTPLNDTPAAISLTQFGVAHELGHAFGLEHTATRVESTSAGEPVRNECDTSKTKTKIWPHDNPLVQEPGFDAESWSVLRSDITYDFMSYCSSRMWISPFHFNRLFDEEFRRAAAPLTEGERQSAPTPQLVISGTVKADGSGGVLEGVLRVVSSAAPETYPATGTFCVEVNDGAAVSRHCVEPSFRDSESIEPFSDGFFTIRVASPANVTRVAILRNGVEVAARTASANTPVVTFTSPAAGAQLTGGPTTLTWTSSDRHGDRLAFTLLYSADGGASWRPLGVDVEGNQLSFNASHIEGGTAVVFRILASDGLRTGEARVGPVTLNQTPRIEAVGTQPIDLGRSLAGRPNEGTFRLRNRGNGPLRIGSITSENPSFVATYPGTPSSIRAGEDLDVLVRFTPATPSNQTATFRIASNDRTTPELRVQVSARGISGSEPKVEVAARAIRLQAAAGQSTTIELQIENAGGADLQVTAAVAPGAFDLRGATALTVRPRSYGSLTVRFTPPALGEYSRQLRLQTNDPNEREVLVSLSGQGVPLSTIRGPVPATASGSVVNGANFLATLAPGMIASVFGANLANGVAQAQSVPLPARLQDARVLVDGVPAPLFYASPNQINFQLPYERAPGPAQIVVERSGVRGAASAVTVADAAPAVFLNSATGGPIVVDNSSFQLVNAGRPASPGDILSLFLTGLGLVTPAVPTGRAAAGLTSSRLPVAVTVGGAAAELFYAGLAPNFVGLGQIVFRVPGPQQSTPTTSLVIRVGSRDSVAVNLPLQRSAGPPPPPSATGVRLQLHALSPNFTVRDDSLRVDVSVLNPQNATGSFDWVYVFSTDPSISLTTDRTTRSGSTIALNSGTERRFLLSARLPADLPSGRYYFAAALSGGSGQVISNVLTFEHANRRPPYDLSVTLQSAAPTALAAGQVIDLVATIRASGSLSQRLQYNLKLSTDATLSGDDRVLRSGIETIEAGTVELSYSQRLPADLAAGRYFIGIEFETEGDSRPQDNVSNTIPITVTP